MRSYKTGSADDQDVFSIKNNLFTHKKLFYINYSHINASVKILIIGVKGINDLSVEIEIPNMGTSARTGSGYHFGHSVLIHVPAGNIHSSSEGGIIGKELIDNPHFIVEDPDMRTSAGLGRGYYFFLVCFSSLVHITQGHPNPSPETRGIGKELTLNMS